MRKRTKYFLLAAIWVISLSVCHGAADSVKTKIITRLAENGFENIAVKITADRIIIAFENRVYRFEPDALKEVIRIVEPALKENQSLLLLPKNRNIPVAAVEARCVDCKNFVSGAITSAEFGKTLNIIAVTEDAEAELKDESEQNSSFFRFDFVLKPSLSFEFGPYTDPIMYQANILPEIRTTLWKGMSLSYEIVVPVKNDFGARYDSVRTGTAVLNQTLGFGNSFYVSSSAGIFTQNRWGADLEARKYFLNGDLSIGANLGYTGFVSFSGFSKVYYSQNYIFTGSVSAGYRIEEYDLSLILSAGKFLNGDKSVRFDISREFGETEIGFFAIRSSEGVSNGGVSISIPLFPSKSFNPGVFRLTGGDYYNTSYIVKSNTNDLIGLRYNTHSRLSSFIKKLNPAFIKNNF